MVRFVLQLFYSLNIPIPSYTIFHCWFSKYRGPSWNYRCLSSVTSKLQARDKDWHPAMVFQ